MSDKRKFDFKTGEVLLVNKPLDWTSFDVVNKLRYSIKRRLDVKKIKVGHAGTLDPLADGLLILCTGRKTKTIESLMGLEKIYSGEITLGSTTPSYDLETEINGTFPTDHFTPELIKAEVNKMIGEYDQLPPIFSAKKVNGKKAYDLARAGIEVELKPKRVSISKFEIVSFEDNKLKFIINCSKGTYIRSIAHDLGENLKSGGHLSGLRREGIGEFSLTNSHTVEEWITIIEESEVLNNEAN
ncbi:MAG: tRNA pseudouridine55 synthase [Arenicella sp.]|jgi:tRNA pseudouridine55 synthase